MSTLIRFAEPSFTGTEEKYIADVLKNLRLSGDGYYTNKCHNWLEMSTGTEKALLTTSCTHALEVCAILASIKNGDEVIMPSFTFSSTANAFVLRGAKIVFVDIRPDTMNIDEKKIEEAITSKTKVIVPVHYAGVACEMDSIMSIAKKYDLLVIEDAAQALGSTYKGKALGTIGHLGTYSFHDTKNITSGEGGALLINDVNFIQRAEVIREKGTNRSDFFKKKIDKYQWVDIGSSYLPSEINAAILLSQLEALEDFQKRRHYLYERYCKELEGLTDRVQLPAPFPDGVGHNAHIFYIKCKDISERASLINFLRDRNICAAFHFTPLHSSPAGKAFGRLNGADRYTSSESEKILRLPLHCNMSNDDLDRVALKVKQFYA